MQKIICFVTFVSIMQFAYCQFHAIYVPEEKLAGIKIDGDITEWEWVPKEYIITTEQMNEVVENRKYNPGSLTSKIIVAWNYSVNRLFLIVQVVDDVRMITDPGYWKDDGLEIAINADNLGGIYNTKSDKRYKNAMKGMFFKPQTENNLEFIVSRGPQWLQKKTEYINWEWKNIKVKNSYVTTYEISIALWDEWSDLGPEFSKRCDLTSDKTIRLVVAIDDSDKDLLGDARALQWVTLSGPDWFKNADAMSQFVLDPPVFKQISWEGIQQVLKP